ncbi:7129_t:CDS:2 [Gigaspora margarita]|uniref:7129_t:CDS:1 n=1 Tax=Gigaspora margarita TaxID=4874 RepID=A0ABN7V3I2_GIGMA|nr:7129_t:CDS:2 [Gigaspora margarita]
MFTNKFIIENLKQYITVSYTCVIATSNSQQVFKTSKILFSTSHCIFHVLITHEQKEIGESTYFDAEPYRITTKSSTQATSLLPATVVPTMIILTPITPINLSSGLVQNQKDKDKLSNLALNCLESITVDDTQDKRTHVEDAQEDEDNNLKFLLEQEIKDIHKKQALQVENYQRKKKSKDIQKSMITNDEADCTIQNEIDKLSATFMVYESLRSRIDCQKSLDEDKKEQGPELESKGDDIKVVGVNVRFIVLIKELVDIEQDHLQVKIIDVDRLFDIRAIKRKLGNESQSPSMRNKVQESVIAKPLSKKENSLEETIGHANNREKVNTWECKLINEEELVEHKECIVY